MDGDPQTLQLLFRVFEAIWRDVDTSAMPLTEQALLRVRIKRHLLEAAEAGESDPEKLRQAARRALTGGEEA
jgi:hypothetical protein